MKALIIDIFYAHGYAYHSEAIVNGRRELEFLRNGLIIKVRIEK